MRWGRLVLAAAIFVFGLAASAVAGPIGDAVFAIEAKHGNAPHEVIRQLQALEAQARAAGGDDLRIFLAAWGYAHASIDKPAVADAAIEELTDLGERTHNNAALASAYTLKAAMLSFSGQVRAAFGWIESAVPLSETVGSPDLHYWVTMTAGDLATSNGHIDEGIRLFEASVAAARQSRNPRREAQAYQCLAPLRLVKGMFDASIRDAVRVRELGAQAQDSSLVISGWVLEALAAEAHGEKEHGVRARRSAMALAEQIRPGADPKLNSQASGVGGLSTEMETLLSLSGMYLSVRDFDAARDYAARARSHAEALHDPDNAARATINLGLADIGAGRLQAGKKAADDGVAALEHKKRDAELLIQINRYAAALERAGDAAAALQRLRESLLLETELARRDRQSTVVALQRESSFQQRQRQMDKLEHDNTLQAVEIARRNTERLLMLLLAGAMAIGVVVAWRLYLRARESNRQLRLNNETLEFASNHDLVTGLFNRRAMERDVVAMNGEPFSGAWVSIKQFGLIVGSVGHQQGDNLLCQIAQRLEEVVLQCGGQLYRVDGVTFAAIYRFAGNETRLRKTLEALTSAMDAPFKIGNQDLIVSIGVGASEYPTDATSVMEVARLAELAKLQAHAEPGNSYVIYDARMGNTQRDKLHMETRMLKALEHGDFEVYYQGQRDLRDGGIKGFEALIRWHDNGKMVSPAQFIPLAEESGLIVRLGSWVLHQACRQAKAWADAGLGRPVVAVNISPRQFNHPDFMTTVRAALQTTGVDPAQIELEITEGSVMDDAEASISQLHALRALGLALAIDDFGTGYASLSYLRRFPLNRLKVDRSFIMQLGNSEGDDTIVRTVIELAHSLGLSVTAEGVETVAQEATLRSWDCDVVQGFLHSRPSPAAVATDLLVTERKGMPAAA
ncbi:bifunctional diguanylate cyclase/phosphodiesterase [Piscinibacter terrae]|uniref:bifunctional diguanylate cyclase/phosphodiesterase n=1 Tax=Piscinibacter terrae TaxID=2496871 RepID=UPI000F5A3071|nr:bifunctional diguanylate cyclase/phosphodiesterase [Albitalea terrae]